MRMRQAYGEGRNVGSRADKVVWKASNVQVCCCADRKCLEKGGRTCSRFFRFVGLRDGQGYV